jgi:hypothetical protein
MNFLKWLQNSISLKEATGIVLIIHAVSFDMAKGIPVWQVIGGGILFGLMWFYMVKE